MSEIILKASDLDGFLTESDLSLLKDTDSRFQTAMDIFASLENATKSSAKIELEQKLIEVYNNIGSRMQDIVSREEHIHVYPFSTPRESHAEVSRLIAKLRNVKTQHHEFVYYTQRAYELLFNLAFGSAADTKRNYIITKTPVTVPARNYAVHKIPDLDAELENAVMCVMLRGALLPSMILSKEIQEYSSSDYITPFALFRIKRDDAKKEYNMEYILDLKKSFFDLSQLDGKTLIFADPMNATGGSLVTIIKYIREQGIKPKSIKFINIISALKGSLRIARALDNVDVYTLWMDPVLNESAYILPGLGDAGDRLNGADTELHPRNIIQLMADYGSDITSLYRSQVRKIEDTVLGGYR
jgi:uracil phosphoribosyltransferase